MDNFDVIVIGKGPAGISAAVYAARAGLSVRVLGRDNGALLKAEKVENYYGFEQPLSGNELVERGIAQAARLGVDILTEEVIGLDYGDPFVVQTKNGTYGAKAVILATGSSRATPNIQGLKTFEGKGVSYCAVCDAFFYKGKDVAVLGEGPYALHEAEVLKPIAQSVTMLTAGKAPTVDAADGIAINDKKIKAVGGADSVQNVAFEDGSTLDVAGLFIAVGVAGSTALARKLGAEVSGNTIVIDEHMQTNVPGLFAAGDCTGGLLQIAKAVSDGARAGTAAVKHVRALG